MVSQTLFRMDVSYIYLAILLWSIFLLLINGQDNNLTTIRNKYFSTGKQQNFQDIQLYVVVRSLSLFSDLGINRFII